MLIEPIAEGAEFLLQLKDLLRVDNCRIDLEPVANDARIVEQACHILLTVLCHFGNLEVVIRLAEIIRFLQDRDP